MAGIVPSRAAQVTCVNSNDFTFTLKLQSIVVAQNVGQVSPSMKTHCLKVKCLELPLSGTPKSRLLLEKTQNSTDIPLELSASLTAPRTTIRLS
jgi:hypothetical protein